MLDIPDKFPLSWLMGRVDEDPCFGAEAVEIRVRIESLQSRQYTYLANSSGMGLVNYWLVQRELTGYERGRLVENFGALVSIAVDGDPGIGTTIRQDSIYIMRDELIALMHSYGMTIPMYLGGSGEKPASASLPAPVEDATADTPAPPVQAEQVRNGPLIKKSAFIGKYGARFPNLSNSFAEASRNGLENARLEGGHGMYYEGEALAWAESRAKQTGAGLAPTPFMHNIFGTVHKQK